MNLNKWTVIICTFAAASASQGALAAPEAWSLESATRRVLEVAPERSQADATVEMRQQELEQAERWPNPSIDLRSDNRVGHLSGQGGSNLSQLAVSQPLPFRRLARQRSAAEANLAAAEAIRRIDLLLLERETARVFYAVQFAAAKHQLADERLKITDTYTGQGASADRLRRYLTPLERQRLNMLREDAQQSVILSQREYDNASIEFNGLLGLAGERGVEAVAPAMPAPAPQLSELEQVLDSHPAVAAARHDAESAQEGIAVAESQRYADPTLKLFRERDYLNGTFYVTGVGISVEVPLWNQNRALEGKARASANASQARLAAAQRDARTRLRQAYSQYARLREQAEQMRTRLVEPARNVLELTRRSFAAGESNVLALVDANNTYFDIRSRYLDLLLGCAMAMADLRVAAGVSITDHEGGQP